MMLWIYAGLGLVILLLAGDSLVRGAVNLSLRVGIPALLVSLTALLVLWLLLGLPLGPGVPALLPR